jgi:phosphoribosylaminoimidazole (AIR) synthetase
LYKASGVDIAAGDNLISRIKPAVARTNRNGVIGSIGGFGGLFDTKAAGYVDPVLVSGTDGVGTKLKVSLHVCVCVRARVLDRKYFSSCSFCNAQ